MTAKQICNKYLSSDSFFIKMNSFVSQMCCLLIPFNSRKITFVEFEKVFLSLCCSLLSWTLVVTYLIAKKKRIPIKIISDFISRKHLECFVNYFRTLLLDFNLWFFPICRKTFVCLKSLILRIISLWIREPQVLPSHNKLLKMIWQV